MPLGIKMKRLQDLAVCSAECVLIGVCRLWRWWFQPSLQDSLEKYLVLPCMLWRHATFSAPQGFNRAALQCTTWASVQQL